MRAQLAVSDMMIAIDVLLCMLHKMLLTKKNHLLLLAAAAALLAGLFYCCLLLLAAAAPCVHDARMILDLGFYVSCSGHLLVSDLFFLLLAPRTQFVGLAHVAAADETYASRSAVALRARSLPARAPWISHSNDLLAVLPCPQDGRLGLLASAANWLAQKLA